MIGILTIIVSEMTLRFVSDSFINNIALLTIPLILILILYLLFYFKFTFADNYK